MKKLSLVFLLLVSHLLLFSYVIEIGDGTDTTQNIPINPDYAYTYSQQIYSVDYFPHFGEITGVTFMYTFVSSNLSQYCNDFVVYLGETEKEYFENDDDWVAFDSLESVYEGDIPSSSYSNNEGGEGELHIEFQNNFDYSGNGNLVLMICENNPLSGDSGDNFYAFETSQTVSMGDRAFGEEIDYTNPATSYCRRTFLPNTKFDMLLNESTPELICPENNQQEVSLFSSFEFKAPIADSLKIFLEYNSEEFLVELGSVDYHPVTGYCITSLHPLIPDAEILWRVEAYENSDEAVYSSEQFSFETEVIESILEWEEPVIVENQVNLIWSSLSETEIVDYQIYKDGYIVAVVNNNSFMDTVILGESYEYQIKVELVDNEHLQSSLLVVDSEVSYNTFVDDSFESYGDFTENLGEWQNIDNDNSITYTIPGYSFVNNTAEKGFITFNPTLVAPPLELNIEGERCLVSLSSVTAPTSDILISTPFRATQLSSSVTLKSYANTWGFERVKYGVIINGDSANPLPLNTGDYVEVPVEWTTLISDYEVENPNDVITNFWIESCGCQSMMLMIDNITLATSQTANSADTSIEKIVSIYPNPVSGGKINVESGRAFTSIKVYNLKGQLVRGFDLSSETRAKQISLEELPIGLYIIKVKGNGYSKTRKVIILH